MQDANEEDRALADRAARGDRAAFTMLVAKHERALRSFLTRMGAGDHADDVAQDAFIKAWRFVAQYDGRAQFKTWLTSIAWRCYLDQLRKGRSQSPAEWAESPSVDTAANVEIGDMLSRLGRTERAALILCEGHGWTHAEAATLLEMPLGTLKSTVARAKEKCRKLWSQSHD